MRLDTVAAVMLVSFVGYYCGEFMDTLTSHADEAASPMSAVESIVHTTDQHPGAHHPSHICNPEKDVLILQVKGISYFF